MRWTHPPPTMTCFPHANSSVWQSLQTPPLLVPLPGGSASAAASATDPVKHWNVLTVRETLSFLSRAKIKFADSFSRLTKSMMLCINLQKGQEELCNQPEKPHSRKSCKGSFRGPSIGPKHQHSLVRKREVATLTWSPPARVCPARATLAARAPLAPTPWGLLTGREGSGQAGLRELAGTLAARGGRAAAGGQATVPEVVVSAGCGRLLVTDERLQEKPSRAHPGIRPGSALGAMVAAASSATGWHWWASAEPGAQALAEEVAAAQVKIPPAQPSGPRRHH